MGDAGCAILLAEALTVLILGLDGRVRRGTAGTRCAGSVGKAFPPAGSGLAGWGAAPLIDQVAAVAVRTGSRVNAGLIVTMGAPPYMRDETVLVDPSGQV
ncbi:hypothetical protein E1286_10395 [Nonomuraea terrae]|uniref:Uncharacterized protein n=1 Tax=Nonomuraea terrae TaxID=2530383 RepID=A0A4R4Z0Z5_9ACTN|nr:hypothetical protein [Nonomuraea terrae]TDD51578.1 hypothetical protein E1286_10395 [Nonomuraea terrae]